MLWTVLALALLLSATGTPYPTYFSGAQFIHFLLGPAVVALAWPLWQRRAELRTRAGALLLAALAGGAAASGSAVGIGWALGLPRRGDCLAGAEVGDGAGGHGHRRAAGRHPGAGGGVRGAHRAGRRDHAPSACSTPRASGARPCAASRWAPRRTASARRARCRCTPTPAPTPALALGLQVLLAALLLPLVLGLLKFF